jgi:hypothetical protein
MSQKHQCKICETEFNTPAKLNKHMSRKTPCKKKSNVTVDVNSQKESQNIKENISVFSKNSSIEENKPKSISIKPKLDKEYDDNTQDIPPQILSDDKKQADTKCNEVKELLCQAINMTGSNALSIIAGFLFVKLNTVYPNMFKCLYICICIIFYFIFFEK